MPNSSNTTFYFCDESSQQNSEYMAVAGIAVKFEQLKEIEKDLAYIKNEHSISSEIKWSKLKARRDCVHKIFVDLMKNWVDENKICLHIRFQRMQDWDHRRSGPRKKIDTVSHAFYQLILHRALRYHGTNSRLNIRPDKGACTSELYRFLDSLNNEGNNRYQSLPDAIKEISPVDSEKSLALQLLDVTLGGLTALRNNRHNDLSTSATKRNLAKYISDKWSSPSLTENSPMSERGFIIWNAEPRR